MHQPSCEFQQDLTSCIDEISQRFQSDLDQHLDAVTIRVVEFCNSDYYQILVGFSEELESKPINADDRSAH